MKEFVLVFNLFCFNKLCQDSGVLDDLLSQRFVYKTLGRIPHIRAHFTLAAKPMLLH